MNGRGNSITPLIKPLNVFPAKRIEIVIETQEEVISYDNLLENLIISDMKYVMVI